MQGELTEPSEFVWAQDGIRFAYAAHLGCIQYHSVGTDLEAPLTAFHRLPQDIVAGDGTTSVVVLCGALLKKALELLERGVHPTIISDSFNTAVNKAVEVQSGCSCLQPWSVCAVGTMSLHRMLCPAQRACAVPVAAAAAAGWGSSVLD